MPPAAGRTALSEKPMHGLANPYPHAWLSRGSGQEASNRALGYIAERASSLTENDWVWLVCELGFESRYLRLCFLSLPRIQPQFVEMDGEFTDKATQVREILLGIVDRLALC